MQTVGLLETANANKHNMERERKKKRDFSLIRQLGLLGEDGNIA